MTTLYNCHHDGDQYRITKFDDDMNVQSSYLCTTDECDCPAGVRPICRHRDMLPKFIQRETIGTEWFLDYDRGGWVQMGPEWAQTVEELEEAYGTTGELPPLPEGITMIVLDSPEKVVEVHNAIAKAVNEPAKRHIPRRL